MSYNKQLIIFLVVGNTGLVAISHRQLSPSCLLQLILRKLSTKRGAMKMSIVTTALRYNNRFPTMVFQHHHSCRLPIQLSR